MPADIAWSSMILLPKLHLVRGVRERSYPNLRRLSISCHIWPILLKSTWNSLQAMPCSISFLVYWLPGALTIRNCPLPCQFGTLCDFRVRIFGHRVRHHNFCLERYFFFFSRSRETRHRHEKFLVGSTVLRYCTRQWASLLISKTKTMISCCRNYCTRRWASLVISKTKTMLSCCRNSANCGIEKSKVLQFQVLQLQVCKACCFYSLSSPTIQMASVGSFDLRRSLDDLAAG